MRFFMIGAGLLLAASVAGAEITRTATFEHFSEGQSFALSFTDPKVAFISAIPPPTLPSGFDFERSSNLFASTHLTSGGYVPGPGGSLSAFFGFSADLPVESNEVRIDAIYSAQPRTDVVLTGFNSRGEAVASAVGPAGLSGEQFSLTLHSAQYDITNFASQSAQVSRATTTSVI